MQPLARHQGDERPSSVDYKVLCLQTNEEYFGIPNDFETISSACKLVHHFAQDQHDEFMAGVRSDHSQFTISYFHVRIA